MTRTDIAGGYEVLAESADGVQTTYKVEFLPTTEELRTTLLPDGTQRTTLIGVDETTTVTEPDGTVQVSQPGPDPRFGMQGRRAGEHADRYAGRPLGRHSGDQHGHRHQPR